MVVIELHLAFGGLVNAEAAPLSPPGGGTDTQNPAASKLAAARVHFGNPDINSCSHCTTEQPYCIDNRCGEDC